MPGKVRISEDPEPGELPDLTVAILPTSDGEGIISHDLSVRLPAGFVYLTKAFMINKPSFMLSKGGLVL